MDDSGKISKGLISFVELLSKLYVLIGFLNPAVFEIVMKNAYEEYGD
jgi:hypothetical protein